MIWKIIYKPKLYLVVLLLNPIMVFSNVNEQSEPQQCIDNSTTYKRFYNSIAGVPHDYQADKSMYVFKARATDTIVDVRQQRFDRPLINTRVNGALQIPLGQIKTKSYLKNESLLLVGDGLDGYFLEKTAKELLEKGFKKVKILEHGIVGLLNDKRLISDGISEFSLKMASAERLIGAAIGDKSVSLPAFKFINLSKSHTIFADLGINNEDYPYESHQLFYSSLRTKVDEIVASNKSSKIVLVHDDEAIYRGIFLAHQSFKRPNVWFLEGGNKALTNLKDKIDRTSIARNKVVTKCHG